MMYRLINYFRANSEEKESKTGPGVSELQPVTNGLRLLRSFLAFSERGNFEDLSELGRSESGSEFALCILEAEVTRVAPLISPSVCTLLSAAIQDEVTIYRTLNKSWQFVCYDVSDLFLASAVYGEFYSPHCLAGFDKRQFILELSEAQSIARNLDKEIAEHAPFVCLSVFQRND